MSKLIFLRGLPGSGKTTYAMELVRNAVPPGSVVRVNKDDIRVKLGMSRKGYKREQEFAVIDHRDHLITEALKVGLNVISDDTNFGKKHEPRLRQIAKEYGAVFELHDLGYRSSYTMFLEHIETCIARDALREGDACVGADVIWGMAESNLGVKRPKPAAPIESESAGLIQVGKTAQVTPIPKPYVWEPNLPSAIICDLDGTLALHNRRSPYDFEKCNTDSVNDAVLLILETFRQSWWEYAESDNMVIYLSGRDDSCRELTKTWLQFNGCPEGQLFMRKTGDKRKDCVVKAEIFDREIRGKYQILFCLDDRDQVVKLWRDMGLTCLQVNYGNF